jgi:hypothetical protein
MKAENKASASDLVFHAAAKIWSPATEALKLQRELNLHSLEETAAAAERVGCEVCYVDLPKKVDGFADIIDRKAHIVLNRSRSQQNLDYTLPHELGHCVLHLAPARTLSDHGLPEIGTAEFQADLFAATWVNWLGNDTQRRELLGENRGSAAAVMTALFLTLALFVVAFVAWLFSEPTHARSLASSQAQ